MPAHIVMPSISAPPKIAATRGYGARVVFSGSTADEREAVCARVAAETGARLVPPYDHPDIILGQGTMGLELQQQVAQMMAEEEEKEKAGEVDGKGQEEKERRGNEKKSKSRGLDAILAPCGGGGMLAGLALSA